MRCKKCGAEWSLSIRGNSVQKFCPVCGSAIVSEEKKQLSSLEETLHVIVRDYGLESLQDGTRAIAFFLTSLPIFPRNGLCSSI